MTLLRKIAACAASPSSTILQLIAELALTVPHRTSATLPSHALQQPSVALDHPISSQEHRLRNPNSKFLCGLEIDHQSRISRLALWANLRASRPQDLDHINRCSPKQVRNVRTVGHETPASGTSLNANIAGRRVLAASSATRFALM